MVHDRRGTRRWCVNRQAKIKLPGAENFSLCQLKDINFKGTQISRGLKLPKDTFLVLHIVLPDEQAVEMEVWIVWHKTIDGCNIYGLYFSRINDADKEKVYQFVRKSCPEQLSKQWWQGLEKEGAPGRIASDGVEPIALTPKPIGWFGVPPTAEGGETMDGSEYGYRDRRVFERFAAKMSMRFLNLNTGKEGYAHTRDFSAKGLGLVTSHGVVPRSLLEIWLDVPDKGEPLYTRGEVVWAKCLAPEQYRVGVSLERADLMGLSRLLRAQEGNTD
jgi:hypothetical protein